MRQMNYQQLEHRALKVRDHNGGQYRGKRLCQTCLMEKAGITSAEEQVAFDAIWYSANWLKSQEWGICDACGEKKEVMTLPVKH